ncbi:MAG: four helix bundle protein [Patescibacteria group bacterium]
MENDKSKINSFVDLLVWQKAHTMFNMVCDDVDTFPSKRVAWVITDQLLRSVGSISANIAEGYGSGYQQEFIHALRIARRENSESLNWFYKCQDRKLIGDSRFKEYASLSEEIRLMLNSLISKLINSKK